MTGTAWRALGGRLRASGRGERLVLGGTLLGHAALGFVPLFGGPGYEAALALGLLLPLPVALLSAGRARRARAGRGAAALALLGSAERFAAGLLVLHLAVLLLHGARVGLCDPSRGLLLFLLGPAAGVILAAAWGTLAGLAAAALPGVAGLAPALGAAGPLGGVVVSLYRFWTSPMVFAFDPFAGFFAGTLYDTVIDVVPRLVSYRAGSAGSLLACVCLCAALDGEGGPSLHWLRRRAGALVLAACGAGLALGVTLAGPDLGHYQTSGSVRRALGHRHSSERCEIVYASGILPERAALLGSECDAHIAAHEAYFGTRLTARVSVLAFASAEQKGWLMGASNTYIAKPWRREVYVQSDNYPHPVLSHELAHVVAGTFASGPLAVAGPLGGWVPDPGRIEGFAVAAAPPADSDFTLLEWTRALAELELLPPLRSLFRLSFLGQNSSTGYTVAGAFVDWLRERHGPASLRAWYGGASLEAAFGGRGLATLEGAFRAELESVVVPERIRELARARFDRPAIFGRRCPHVVDERLRDAAAAFERFDLEAASAAYDSALELDPGNLAARFGLAACAERGGAAGEALARYGRLARDESLTRVQRVSALERLGDRALLVREDELAAQLYAEAEAFAFDEHRARTLQVKLVALADPTGRPAIEALLIGDPRLGSEIAHAMAQLGAWSVADPERGLADYLIGKNLYARARWREARDYLARALARDLQLASVRREALRTQVFVLCALGEPERAAPLLREYLHDPGLSSARKTGMQRFAPSCHLRNASP